MPTQETQYLDNVISSRRALLVGGGVALAALALTKPAAAASTVATGTYSDNDILNFALNLEYLEANFYYLAAFGCTIDSANTTATTAGATTLGYGTGTAASSGGVVATVTGTAASNKVPFVSPLYAAYAVETAIEEGKHVTALRGALGSLAVAQPAINLTQAWFNTLATAAGVSPTLMPFNPYANDAYFLLGAYIFEDVGVSAYHGAAPLITQKATVLPVAAGILAVEAYHAGLIRTSLNALDAATTYGPAGTLITVTNQISALRSTLAHASGVTQTGNVEDPATDDYGLATQTFTLNASATTGTQIVDTEPQTAALPATAFARTTTQVLNIVCNGTAGTAGTKAAGGFFPNGLNGLFT